MPRWNICNISNAKFGFFAKLKKLGSKCFPVLYIGFFGDNNDIASSLLGD